jgi:hypothetical protein
LVKRPVGVVVNAILMALISLLLLVMALSFALVAAVGRNAGAIAGATPGPALPPWMAGMELALCAVFVGLAAWGITTVAGLFGMRRWARFSVLIIGGGLAVVGLISVLSTALMMAAFPAPPAGGLDPSQAQMAGTMVKVFFAFTAVFYALLTGLGVYWLVYFNLKRVRAAFGGADGTEAESPRPVMIGVLAVLCMLGAPICLLSAWFPFPAMFFGLAFHGAAKATIFVSFGILQGAAGVGLWQLKEWGRRLELVFLGLGVVNSAVYVARPSLVTRMSIDVSQAMRVPQQPWTEHFQTVMARGTFAFSILLMVAMMVVLAVYRGKFGPKVETAAA